MDADIAFVKEQIYAQEKMILKYQETPHRAALHSSTKSRLEALLATLVEIQSEADSMPSSTQQIAPRSGGFAGIHLSLADIEGAPEELLDELSISESDRQEMFIADIISGFGGVASLDKILVFLHKRTGVIVKRNTLVSKLYRMAEKKMIFNVPGKRGVYASFEIKEDEAERLFGKAQFDGPSDSQAVDDVPFKRRL
jgi:hypothetical protein